jgi:hypothetical protein
VQCVVIGYAARASPHTPREKAQIACSLLSETTDNRQQTNETTTVTAGLPLRGDVGRYWGATRANPQPQNGTLLLPQRGGIPVKSESN